MHSNFIRQNSNLTNNNNASSEGSFPISDDPATLIHTSFAKVYTMALSPKEKEWISITQNAVPVSFYFDKQRKVYRILSYDGDKLVINSTIVPSMSFVKPSSTFALWSDTKLKVIFGLGFESQAVRDLACEWFIKVVKAATNLEQGRTSMTLPPPEVGVVPYSATTYWTDGEITPDSGGGAWRMAPPDMSCPPDLDLEEYAPNKDRFAIAVGGAIREQSVRSLQHEEERERKLMGLEKELSELKLIFTNTHESLMSKMKDQEALVHELKEAKDQLQVQISRAEKAENLNKQEKDKTHKLKVEIDHLNTIITTQTSAINEVQERKRDIEQESKMLRDSLRFTRSNVDEAEKDLGNLGTTCVEISKKMEELFKIQERLKNNLKSNNNN